MWRSRAVGMVCRLERLLQEVQGCLLGRLELDLQLVREVSSRSSMTAWGLVAESAGLSGTSKRGARSVAHWAAPGMPYVRQS